MPRISQLPSLTAADNADELAIVDVSASTTKKITRGDLLKSPLPTNSVTTAAVANGAITASKTDFTTLSTTEKVVGKWIDGKSIYQKVVNVGSLTNGGTKSVAHGITGIQTVIDLGGVVSTSAGLTFPLPFTSAADVGSSIQLTRDGANIVVNSAATDRTAFSGYVIIMYTKS